METCWNNIKLDWETLLEMLPTMLDENGKYVQFGCEPDSTPYTVARARIANRDCWVISDSAEDSTAFIMECSKTTKGYMDDFKEWLAENWIWGWDDDVWVSNTVFNQK